MLEDLRRSGLGEALSRRVTLDLSLLSRRLGLAWQHIETAAQSVGVDIVDSPMALHLKGLADFFERLRALSCARYGIPGSAPSALRAIQFAGPEDIDSVLERHVGSSVSADRLRAVRDTLVVAVREREIPLHDIGTLAAECIARHTSADKERFA